MKLIALMSLHLCKYLQVTFVFFCATSVVQIYLANNDFIWSVTYYSYCSVLIRNFEEKKAYTYTLLSLT